MLTHIGAFLRIIVMLFHVLKKYYLIGCRRKRQSFHNSVNSQKAHRLYGHTVYGDRLIIIIHINTGAVIITGVINILSDSVVVSDSFIAQILKYIRSPLVLTLSLGYEIKIA